MSQPLEVSTDSKVVGVPWDVFLHWFGDVWQPGEHMACIGPSGAGKSTFVMGVLGLRKHVLAIDPKGEDTTLTDSGFRRINSWPPPDDIRQAIADGKGARLIVGGRMRSATDWDVLSDTVGKALDGSFQDGGWTVFLDELQIATQMMRHGVRVQRNLVAARDKGVSMVTAYQAPSWVPTAASRQATWLAVWPTRDEDVIKSIARKSGRPVKEMTTLLHELPDFHCVLVGKNPRHPMVMTHPDRLTG